VLCLTLPALASPAAVETVRLGLIHRVLPEYHHDCRGEGPELVGPATPIGGTREFGGASYTVFLLVVALLLFGAKLLFITRACAARWLRVRAFLRKFLRYLLCAPGRRCYLLFRFVYYYFIDAHGASCAAVLALRFTTRCRAHRTRHPAGAIRLEEILVVGTFSVIVGYLIVSRLAREDLLRLARRYHIRHGLCREKASGLSTTLLRT